MNKYENDCYMVIMFLMLLMYCIFIICIMNNLNTQKLLSNSNI